MHHSYYASLCDYIWNFTVIVQPLKAVFVFDFEAAFPFSRNELEVDTPTTAFGEFDKCIWEH